MVLDTNATARRDGSGNHDARNRISHRQRQRARQALGHLLMVADAGSVVSCATFSSPEQFGVVNRRVIALYFGEVPIILWMTVEGAKPRTACENTSNPIGPDDATRYEPHLGGVRPAPRGTHD